MKTSETPYTKWVEKLVKNTLPLELQQKIISLQPLTKEESQKFIDVVQLANQAKGLGEHEEMLKRLRNLCDGMRKSHQTECEILSWVSDGKPNPRAKDNRQINKTKHDMVLAAARAIYNSPPEQATEIGMQFFLKFKNQPGAYTNFRSFMKQIQRTLQTSK